MKSIAIPASILAAGLAVAVGNSKIGPVQGHVDQLQKAASLSAEFTVTAIGRTSPATYRVQLSKPNKFRIDTPAQTVVGDGSMLSTLDKRAKTWYRDPQTPAAVAQVFANDDLKLFAPFFAADALANSTVKQVSTRKRKGMDLQAAELTLDAAGKKTGTFFLDGQGIARQLEFFFADDQSRILVDTKELTLGTEAKADDLFAFKAPDDARELTAEERMADKWYHDVDEALAVAKRTNRMVFLDIYASWCGPCNMIMKEVFPTEAFKKQSKHFVFVKIDGDINKGIMSRFGANAFPTLIFLKNDGTEVHRFLGFKPVDSFVAEMEKARSLAN